MLQQFVTDDWKSQNASVTETGGFLGCLRSVRHNRPLGSWSWSHVIQNWPVGRPIGQRNSIFLVAIANYRTFIFVCYLMQTTLCPMKQSASHVHCLLYFASFIKNITSCDKFCGISSAKKAAFVQRNLHNNCHVELSNAVARVSEDQIDAAM